MDLILILDYLRWFAALMVGFTIHNSLKFDTLKKMKGKEGQTYSIHQYLVDEAPSHITNLACCFLWMLVLQDLLNLTRESDWVRYAITLMSATVGYANSSLVLKILGRTQKAMLTKADAEAKEKER